MTYEEAEKRFYEYLEINDKRNANRYKKIMNDIENAERLKKLDYYQNMYKNASAFIKEKGMTQEFENFVSRRALGEN